MANQAIFKGLVFDESGNPVDTAVIGGEAFYIADDSGFKRHISSESVDRQVFQIFTSKISGNEDYIATAAAQSFGADDLFSMAIFKNKLKNIDKEIDEMFSQGLPPDITSMMGLNGFRVIIDIHGNVIGVETPGAEEDDE